MEELTNNIPKPLLPLGETTIIERLIEQMLSVSRNIFIIVGYQNKSFSFLKEKYPLISIIYNKDWEKQNNISSINVIKEKLSNSLIVNGDTIIQDISLISNEYESSCMYVEKNKNINEWLININDKNEIQNWDTNPINKSGYFQREITFINNKMAYAIKKEIDEFPKDLHYEYLVLKCSRKYNLSLKIYKIKKNKIFDIDTKQNYLNFIYKLK